MALAPLVSKTWHPSIMLGAMEREFSVQFSMDIPTRFSDRRVEVVICDDLGINAAPRRNSQTRKDSRLIWL
jgi:hypothetical protein